MLEEIREITNVGTFHAFKPQTPIALRRLTLIYGPNGTGKTTLCAILRSLARNEPDLLAGRKTLNREGESRVELGLSNNGRCVWDGTAWSGDPPKPPKIEIFDEQFVRDNLYTDTVEVDQKRNLLRIILGEEEVAINNEIRNKTEYQNTVQNKIRERETTLATLLGKTMGLNDFLALIEDPEVEKKIDQQRKKVAAHENAKQLQMERGLELLPLPEPLEGLEVLLGRTFEELAADAEQLLQRHLDRCEGEPGYREWLERGLDYVKDEICPFCGQSVSSVDLVHAYRTIFSQRYRAHKAEIEAMLAELERRFGGEASARFAAIVANNAERARFWEPFVATDWSILNVRLYWKEPWEGYYSAARTALDRKRSSPLEPVSAEELRQREERLRTILKDLHKQNNTVATINSKIEDLKRSVCSEEVERAKEELARLELVRQRFERQTIEYCNEYKNLKDQKRRIEEEKEVLKSRIDSLSEKALGASMKRINELLEQVNAGFRLHEMTRKQTKGWGEALWTIAIRETPIDVGKKATPRVPNFKNTLSAGDRSALAFAFFLAQLEQKPDLGERIVVLDDPFTSQDAHRRHLTRDEIKKVFDRVRQIIVLSHEANFLLDLAEDFSRQIAKSALKLRWGKDVGTAVERADLSAEATDRVLIFEGRMVEFLTTGQGDVLEIACGLRDYVEQKLKVLFPSQARIDATLAAVLNDLKRSNLIDGEDCEILNTISAYCNRWKHATGRVADLQSPDERELQGMINKVLDVIGKLMRRRAS